MSAYQHKNIEIYYPTCYEDIQHLGVGDFRKTTEFFQYHKSMIVYNKALPKANSHFVFAFYKCWLWEVCVDCFTSDGTEFDLESACREINAYWDNDIHTFIEKIPPPSMEEALMDDWD